MANELNSDIETARRLLLPIGSLILLFLIIFPVMHMKAANAPLVIALAILGLLSLAVSILFYYRPNICITECGKWLPPFNTAIISALCFTIILWALADLDYNIKASMAMILLVIAAYFTVSEDTYFWKRLGG